jgi:SAM-dependent methyltransferase
MPTSSVVLAGAATEISWLGDGTLPPGSLLQIAGDQTTAQDALRHLRHDWLVFRGNYKNARQLLSALGRRLARRRENAQTPLELFRAQRLSRQQEHETLSRLLVELDSSYELSLASAAAVAEACRWRWPAPTSPFASAEVGPTPGLIPLRQLLGIVSAYEWYRKGLEVAGLHARLHPHYGVFTPTRGVYPELLRAIPNPVGRRVFDIGAGTGVLGFLLLERGAARVVATDIDPAAVASAREDAMGLGFADRFEARELDLFPEGRADIIVCNPPWLPEAVRGRLDAAVFDPESRFLGRFLTGLPTHLESNGLGCLLISNLAELLGLRSGDYLSKEIERAGLRIAWKKEAPAAHPRSQDTEDRLHAVRSKEVVTLYGLAAITA